MRAGNDNRRRGALDDISAGGAVVVHAGVVGFAGHHAMATARVDDGLFDDADAELLFGRERMIVTEQRRSRLGYLPGP